VVRIFAAALALALLAAQDTPKARQALEQLKSKYPAAQGYRHSVDGFMAHACKSGAAQEQRTNRFLRTYAAWAAKNLFDKTPELLRVLSFEKTADFRANGGGSGAAGFYRPSELTLYNNLETGLGTVGHEMTHALMIADWNQKIPNGWFLEGFAAMQENCLRLKDGTYVGIYFGHWRFLGVKPKIVNGSIQKLRDCMNVRNPEGNSYAQGRWILTYIHVQGLLKKLQDEYRRTVDQDGAGIAAFEKVTGKSVEEWEKEWHAWSKEIEMELDDARKHDHPVLGVLGRSQAEGLEIAAVSAGSPADLAKLQAGDTIVRFDGKAIRAMADLVGALKSKSDGARVKIEFKRGGAKTQSATATLNQFIDG
jgi:hypothetical protein